jgi:hypothetical protein
MISVEDKNERHYMLFEQDLMYFYKLMIDDTDRAKATAWGYL